MHDDEQGMQHAHKKIFACTKLATRKSIKTSLSSAPVIFKLVSYLT